MCLVVSKNNVCGSMYTMSHFVIFTPPRLIDKPGITSFLFFFDNTDSSIRRMSKKKKE